MSGLLRSSVCRNLKRFSLVNHKCLYSTNNESYKLENALMYYKDFKLRPLRVGSCIFGQRFSNPGIEVFDYIEDTEGKLVRPEWLTLEDIERGRVRSYTVDFKSLFSEGFGILENYLEGKGTEKENRHVKSFTQRFLSRSEYHENRLWSFLNDNYSDLSETEITTTLTVHLLSLLVMEKTRGYTYIVANDVSNKFRKCPCLCGEPLHYGKTDFGSRYLWYGRPDIMLFPDDGGACHIFMKKYTRDNFGTMEEHEPHEVDRQMIDMNEVKCTDFISSNNGSIEQVVKQCITISFYQKKYQLLKNWGSRPIVSIIPTIALSPQGFDVYIYDSENDILLRNVDKPIPLWRNKNSDSRTKEFDMSAVLQLWLTLNHLIVKPSFSNDEIAALSGSGGFLQQVDETRMEKFQATLGLNIEYEPSVSRIKDQVPLIPASQKVQND